MHAVETTICYMIIDSFHTMLPNLNQSHRSKTTHFEIVINYLSNRQNVCWKRVPGYTKYEQRLENIHLSSDLSTAFRNLHLC